MTSRVLMDLDLARRLERAEGAVGATFVETRRTVAPAHAAEWSVIGGAYAMYDGPWSAMTQTFGLGLLEEATDAVIEECERYFTQRGADTHHEVSPLAGIAAVARLVARGYEPIELASVLVRSLAAPPSAVTPPAGLAVRVVAVADTLAYVDASVTGWDLPAAAAEMVRGVAEIAAANPALVNFVVEAEGAMIATGSLGVHAGVALLAGASTVPRARGRGAQALLLAARLAEAARRGCTLAMMVAEPGSTSQRNAERNDFAIAYTRTKWRRGMVTRTGT